MLCMVPMFGLLDLPGDVPIGAGVVAIGMAPAPVLGALMLNRPNYIHEDMFFLMRGFAQQIKHT